MALATRSKPTVHSRKRQAGHHRHSRRYIKPYWPYLPMLLIIGVGLVLNHAWNNQAVLGAATSYNTAGLLSATNDSRRQTNEAQLTLNPQLTAAAQAKADDMVQHDYWAHVSPTGQTPWSFIASSGYTYQSAGENLAYGFANAQQSIRGWLNSPEHRANMLNSTFRDVGFGIANSPDYQGSGPQTIVVAEYAQPAVGMSGSVLGAYSHAASQPVARIQTLSDTLPLWGLAAAITISGLAMTLLVIRHGYRLHRLLSRGEQFVTHHPIIDIIIVVIITVGCLLTRTSGFIR